MQAKHKEAGKTRSTVILSLPTQALQHEVVRRGIVIDAQLYDTYIWDHGIEAKLCFNCSAWGHTQSACGKMARCGQCAGAHQTRECTHTHISCVNCGRPHRAWQKQECRTYKSYAEGLIAKRMKAYAATAAIRGSNAGETPARPHHDGFQLVVSKKRSRSPASSAIGSSRKLGRPTHIEVAARDPLQARLQASQSSIVSTASGPPSTQSARSSNIMASQEVPEEF